MSMNKRDTEEPPFERQPALSLLISALLLIYDNFSDLAKTLSGCHGQIRGNISPE